MKTSSNKEMNSQNEPIKILSAPLGLLLKISIGVAGAGALWAIFAKVPWQVDGLSTITPPGGLSDVNAPNEGTLVYVRDERGRIIADAEGKQTLKEVTNFLNGMYDFDETSKKYINDPSAELYAEFNQKIDTVINITTASVFDEKELGKGGRAVFESDFPYLDKNDIVAYIHNPNRKVKVINAATDARSKLKALSRTMETYQRQKQSYTSRLLKVKNAYRDVAKHFTINKDFETTLRKLNQAGFVPNNTYISGISSTANFSSLGEQYLQQGQQLTIELNNVDNQVNEAINEVVSTVTDLRDSVNEYIAESYVFMPQSGYLVEYSSVNLTNVVKDTPVFEYTDSTPKLPEYTYAFFGAQQASQVFPGMRVLSTPLGISRSQYGGIKGSIVSIDKNPAGQASINSVSGSSQVAKTFIESLQIPYRVLIKLEIKENVDIKKCSKANRKETCYKWNSGAIPPFPVKIGNVLAVQATTTEYTPLQLMIPRLRLFFGLETEAPGIKKVSN